MAVNRRTFDRILDVRSPIKPILVFIVCLIFIFLIMLVLLALIFVLHCIRGTFKKGELNRNGKAAIMSSAIISISRLLYFIALDSCAVHLSRSTTNEAVITHPDKSGELPTVLNNIIPIILLISDLVLFFLSIIFVIISTCIATGICNYCACGPNQTVPSNNEPVSEHSSHKGDSSKHRVCQDRDQTNHEVKAEVHTKSSDDHINDSSSQYNRAQ